jgi:RimJ/RimL family protein N-acetyltransferase
MTELVLFNKEHLDNTFEWMQNVELKKMFLLDKEISKSSHLDWFESIQDDCSQEIFAIIYNKHHVGNIGLKNIDAKNKKAEIWVYLGDLDYRGKGIAKKSLLQLENNKVGELNKIYAHIADYNFSSFKTFASVGYTIEAFFQKDMLFKNRFINIYRLHKLI